MTRRRLPLADRLRVRTPCDVGFGNMEERGRDRHCTRCDLVVHDVASMTRAEVEDLLEARERGERVCLHLTVRRSDGAVLVADGHIERAPPRRPPASRMVAAAMATATAMTACASTPSPRHEAPVVGAVIPVEPAATPPAVIADPPPAPPPDVAPAPTPAIKPKPAKPSPPPYYELDGDAY